MQTHTRTHAHTHTPTLAHTHTRTQMLDMTVNLSNITLQN